MASTRRWAPLRRSSTLSRRIRAIEVAHRPSYKTPTARAIRVLDRGARRLASSAPQRTVELYVEELARIQHVLDNNRDARPPSRTLLSIGDVYRARVAAYRAFDPRALYRAADALFDAGKRGRDCAGRLDRAGYGSRAAQLRAVAHDTEIHASVIGDAARLHERWIGRALVELQRELTDAALRQRLLGARGRRNLLDRTRARVEHERVALSMRIEAVKGRVERGELSFHEAWAAVGISALDRDSDIGRSLFKPFMLLSTSMSNGDEAGARRARSELLDGCLEAGFWECASSYLEDRANERDLTALVARGLVTGNIGELAARGYSIAGGADAVLGALGERWHSFRQRDGATLVPPKPEARRPTLAPALPRDEPVKVTFDAGDRPEQSREHSQLYLHVDHLVVRGDAANEQAVLQLATEAVDAWPEIRVVPIVRRSIIRTPSGARSIEERLYGVVEGHDQVAAAKRLGLGCVRARLSSTSTAGRFLG